MRARRSGPLPCPDGLSSVLISRLVPESEVLSFLALAVMALWGEIEEVMLLVLYDHTAQYIRTYLIPDFLAKVAAASDPQPIHQEAAHAAHQKLDMRTIRSARGPTSSAVVLLAHQRYAKGHFSKGQWAAPRGYFERQQGARCGLRTTQLAGRSGLRRMF